MIHKLSNPKGLDLSIQEIQIWLHDKLSELWGADSLDAYGKIYIQEREGNVIPEVFDSITQNYREVFYNAKSCLFFVDEDRHIADDQDHEFTAPVKIVFMLNLDQIKNNIERADSEVKEDVIRVLRDYDYQFRIKAYVKGIRTTLNEFTLDPVKHNDLHPLHVFGIEADFNYSVI